MKKKCNIVVEQCRQKFVDHKKYYINKKIIELEEIKEELELKLKMLSI